MASLESGVCYLYLDTGRTLNVPGFKNVLKEAYQPYQNDASTAKRAAKPAQLLGKNALSSGAFRGWQRRSLAPLSHAIFPCQATSMGAATAIEE